MKKIQIICSLLLIAFFAQAQTVKMSTSAKQTCYWNETTQKFDRCGDNTEFNSLYTLNADETMFNHVTDNMKSTYYVSKKEYMSSYDIYQYKVTSDVGNKYTFFVDLKNNLLKIMSDGHASSADDYLILFTIKRSWKE